MNEVHAVLALYGLGSNRAVMETVSTGFSGAGVWRIDDGSTSYALKRWPVGQPAYVSLERMHECLKLARESGLGFVPRVLPNQEGRTVTAVGPGVWELTCWQGGVAVESPSQKEVRAAVLAVAQLHAAWRDWRGGHDVSQGVRLRHQRLTESSKYDVRAVAADALIRRTIHCLNERREHAVRLLEPWMSRKLPLQLCVGDVWAEHVLFTAGQVTGVVDYGGMRMDHPAQDVARLLGSYRLTRQDLLEGVMAYPCVTDEFCALTLLLMETGRVAALANWLRWLVVENRTFANREAVWRRLERLVAQAETQW